MAGKLSPFGVFGKWVIAPALMVLLGYYVVGPRIGKTTKPGTILDSNSTIGPANADPPAEEKTSSAKPHSAGPEVDVTVNPANAGQSGTEVAQATSKPQHRRHKKAAPRDSEGNTQILARPGHTGPPSEDEGGSAGSTTAG